MTDPVELRQTAAVFGPTNPNRLRTRAAVLLAIKEAEVVTATTLAKTLQCALNTVRHHLKELESEGTVSHELTHQGVGAPAHAYRLTARGHGLFPDRYAGTVALLLDELVALQGREASVALMRTHFAELGERICREATALPLAARGERIARALEQEGFMATWQDTADGGVLVEHNCPHRLVAERFPEVCAAEEAFLSRAFGATVLRQSRIAAGCGCCRYQVTPSVSAMEDAP